MKTFGTAGVRGIFNETQTANGVYGLVETIAFVFGRGCYGVGWDGRKSSFVLARAVSSAIAATGSDAFLFGLIPTPVLAFGTSRNGCPAGFSVTASHNPREFSGVKIFNRDGMELSSEEEARIERALVVSSWKSGSNFGSVAPYDDVLGEYQDELLSKFTPVKRGLKIVVDCGNGAGGLVTPSALMNMGHKVVPLNSQISWRFPARPPEPTADNLKDTANVVVSTGSDLGFAHDGDADRLVIINSGGQVVPDSITSIVAMRALSGHPGSVVLSENTSSVVAEEAERLGLEVVRSKVGKTFTKIRSENAIFATEPSKIVDPSWGMWEDGMYCALLIAGALSKEEELSALLRANMEWKYRQVNLSIMVDFEALVKQAEEAFGRFRILEKRELDGLKLVFKDCSWIMFRASGTEPKVRIYCESKDELRLEELVQEGIKCAESSVVGRRVG